MPQPSLDLSVIIPTYNRPSLLEETVRSVLAQTRPAREVIIVDNGTNEESATMLTRFGDAVRCIRNYPPGMQAARNAGVRAASTRWVAMLDDDDLYRPSFLASIQPALEDGRADVICTDHIKFDNEHLDDKTNFERVPLGYWNGIRPSSSESWTLIEEFPVEKFAIYNPFYPSTLAVKRRVFDEIGGYDECLNGLVAEDIDFLIRVLHAHRLAIVWAPLVDYRVHGGNDSGHDRRGYNRQARGKWQVIAATREKMRLIDPAVGDALDLHLPTLRARAFDAAFGLRDTALLRRLARELRLKDWTAKRRLKRLAASVPSALSPIVFRLIERVLYP